MRSAEYVRDTTLDDENTLQHEMHFSDTDGTLWRYLCSDVHALLLSYLGECYRLGQIFLGLSYISTVGLILEAPALFLKISCA